MRIRLKIENNIIVDVKFKTFGCGTAIATSSMATELIKGKHVDEVLSLTNRTVVKALDGLPPVKLHGSVLAEEAVKTAINDYYKRNGIDKVVEINDHDCDCSAFRDRVHNIHYLSKSSPESFL